VFERVVEHDDVKGAWRLSEASLEERNARFGDAVCLEKGIGAAERRESDTLETIEQRSRAATDVDTDAFFLTPASRRISTGVGIERRRRGNAE
jgi:hypothetical protein